MLHVVRSELTRLAQRRTLGVWFGLMALFAIMVNTVMGTVIDQAASSNLPSPGVIFPTRAELESASGPVAGLQAATNMFGLVTLSLWAFFTAQDYSSGLIRLLVAAEPRRWRLLAGKAIALVVVTAAAVTVGTFVNLLAVPAVAASGIATAEWGKDAPRVLAEAWGNLFLSQLVWGAIGMVIAVLTRSATAGVAIGAGYILVVESMVRMVDGAPVNQLLGTTLAAIAKGGTAAVSYSAALGLGVGYVIVGLLVAGLVFTRRDVTD